MHKSSLSTNEISFFTIPQGMLNEHFFPFPPNNRLKLLMKELGCISISRDTWVLLKKVSQIEISWKIRAKWTLSFLKIPYLLWKIYYDKMAKKGLWGFLINVHIRRESTPQSTADKGQLSSEWSYEVIVSPKMPTKNLKDFCPTL